MASQHPAREFTLDTPDVHEEPSPRAPETRPSVQLLYRLQQQRLLAEFGYFALSTGDFGALLQEATRVAAQGLEVKFSKLLEHRGNAAGFLVVAGVGWNPGVVGRATVGDDMESPAGYAFHSAQVVISNHLANEQRFRTPSLLVEHGVTRAINVIIQTEETRYGVLEVDTPSEGRFDEDDASFLKGLAALLGVAIQRDRREAELKRSENALKAAMAFQEVLTQEASHRVKNSLSIVAGLLSMQARTSKSTEVSVALRSAGRRVGTIAAVHDRLWRKNQARAVDLGAFLDDLCGQLAASTSGNTVECRSVAVEVATEQAMSVGLLVNELATNAFKYAYDETGGHVQVELLSNGEGGMRLSVSDSGKGDPANFASTETASLGLKLIRSLGDQLGGNANWRNGHPGTIYELDFSIVPPMAADDQLANPDETR
ncbi:two-component sensor histidine kinase [Rhizobium sp. PP-F2F-G48]|uniref:sensor histidine kinase n=1 Tax=Rhizobium sp. PP-F2F-G48 TaxID=2135651 RepID=UPI001048B9D5|nr:histidine kinase dimerization/phosphoacceptor domain -containing protein [Rhizobium sp. PP-F2F-G48]TCM45528.1 two-component sensor histidine kinase [Rhizobium sp. PP-F2F-G48]